MYYESNNTLQHHGILGQKWGVRRFQNKDGSYTSAGEKHRGHEDSSPSVSGYKKTKVHNVYDVNSNYYNKRAAKLQKKADVNKTLASMNEDAAKNGKGLLAKANQINANYYNKKASKIQKKADVNKTMASMNEAQSKAIADRKAAKAKEKAQKVASKNATKKVSEVSKNAVSGKAAYNKLLANMNQFNANVERKLGMNQMAGIHQTAANAGYKAAEKAQAEANAKRK